MAGPLEISQVGVAALAVSEAVPLVAVEQGEAGKNPHRFRQGFPFN